MRTLSSLCLLTLVAQTAAASGDYSLEAHISYGQSGSDSESVQEIIRLSPGLELSLAPRTRFVFEGRLRLDFADTLEPGQSETDSYSSLSRPALLSDNGTAEIRDAYLEQRYDNGVLRLGKQQIVWGKLDGIKVLDILNPQDFREFVLDDFSESRISLWSAYLDVTLAGWRTELAVIPDDSGHAIPTRGAWFELSAPRYRFGADAASTGLPVTTHRDSAIVGNSAFGVRLSRQLGAVELAGIVYSGMDHEPVGRVINRGAGPEVERFYERRDVVGLSAETSLGSLVIRGEIALQPDRVFNARPGGTLSTVALDQLRAAVGVDVDGPWDTFVNVQYLQDRVDDAPTTLVRPDTDRILTTAIKRSFNYETVRLTAKWYRSLEQDDEMHSLSIDFSLGDGTTIQLAAQLFSGDRTGMFGQFADHDRITFGLTHTF